MRFPPLELDQMNPAQRKIADAILAGPRGSLRGPFNTWLRSPELADRLQKVGEYIRFNSSLPQQLNEFAILIVAREWSASFEWYAHEPMAIKAGLPQSITDQLREGKRPEGMSADEFSSTTSPSSSCASARSATRPIRASSAGSANRAPSISSGPSDTTRPSR